MPIIRPMKSLLFLTAVVLCLPAGAQVRKARRLKAPAATSEAAAINDSNQPGCHRSEC